MPPTRIDPTDLASVLPPGGLTLLSSCSAESGPLSDAIVAAGSAIGAMTFTGIFVPGLNRCRWLANESSRALTFFMTPELRAAGDRVDFLPLRYADILSFLRAARPSAAMFMTSVPDADGYCSFGPAVDFLADLWRDIPVRIAHINPLVPATNGHRGIPFSELSAWFEADGPLLAVPDEAPDAATLAIASHVAQFVSDGATIQTGLGRIPGAVLRALTDRRDLRLHSGLVGDAALDLAAAGALAPGASACVGVAIGSPRLYQAISDPLFDFQPVSITHGQERLRAIRDFVTINSGLEVDLFGQVFAELTPKGLMSGPGGALDFAQGARSAGGLRIVALPASASGGRISRIVAPGEAAGPVSLGRMDVDVVVTEHGAADLRFKPYEAKAQALIAISDPAGRDELSARWMQYRSRL